LANEIVGRNVMDQRIIDLYNDYVHSAMSRRAFLARLAVLAGGAAAAAALLPLLEGGDAQAAVIDPEDGRIAGARVSFPGASGPVKAYAARAAAAQGLLPGVVVIHENRGLTPHIEDIARRLALAGFHALAVDALSPLGGTPADRDAARDMIGALDPATTLGDYAAALDWLKGQAGVNGKAGAVGFCWGGAMVGRLAVSAPQMDAGVVFYGAQPPEAEAAKITAPLLLHYAALDARITGGAAAFAAALAREDKTFAMHVYDNVNHAFNNDARPARFDAGAADLAMGRTVAFLHAHLG